MTELVKAGLRIPSEIGARDYRRLCGFLMYRPESPFRLPSFASSDTPEERRSLAYVNAPGFSGVRLISGGASPRYTWIGLSHSGTTIATVEADLSKVRRGIGDGLGGDSATTFVADELAGLDTAIEALAISDKANVSVSVVDASPPETDDPDLAVPDVRAVPSSEVHLVPGCNYAVLGTSLFAGLERELRVGLADGQGIVVRVTTGGVDAVVAVNEPARPSADRSNAAPTVEATVTPGRAQVAVIRTTIAPRKSRDLSLRRSMTAFATIAIWVTTEAPVM